MKRRNPKIRHLSGDDSQITFSSEARVCLFIVFKQPLLHTSILIKTNKSDQGRIFSLGRQKTEFWAG